MSSSDFLKELIKAGKAYSGGGGQGIVGRIKIEFGLHRYVAGHDFWSFWKPVSGSDEIESVGAELTGRMQKAGSIETPNFGVKVTIDRNVLSRDEPYKADLQEFTPDWQEDAFNLIYDFIDKQDLPVGEWFYGRIQYKANPFSVKKGEAGKTETDQNGNPRYPSIRVPTEKFATEEAARAEVGGGGNANSNSQWSETARANYPDLSVLESFADEVNEWLEKAQKSIPYINDGDIYPLPAAPITPPKAKAYIAEIYDCEPADIDLLIPF